MGWVMRNVEKGHMTRCGHILYEKLHSFVQYKLSLCVILQMKSGALKKKITRKKILHTLKHCGRYKLLIGKLQKRYNDVQYLKPFSTTLGIPSGFWTKYRKLTNTFFMLIWWSVVPT